MYVTSLLCGSSGRFMAVLWVVLFIFEGYGNDRFFSHTNPCISNVISSLGYLWRDVIQYAKWK